MSKQGGKQSFFNKLFSSKKHKENTLVDGQIEVSFIFYYQRRVKRHRDRNGVKFANESRYYENRTRVNQSFNEEDLRDEQGLYKATAPYHTSVRTKATRGTRSCYSKMNADEPLDYESDNSTSNRSYHTSFNPADISKRNFRRTSKRPKKITHNQTMFQNYDDETSSSASYKVLQTVDLNSQYNPRNKPNEQWIRTSRHQEDTLFRNEVCCSKGD